MNPDSPPSRHGVNCILVVGHQGMLGADLTRILTETFPDTRLSGLDLPEFDITDERGVEKALDMCRPDVVVNCAAYTDVDGCETETRLAMAVNGDGPGFLARAAKRTGARLIHVSTDFVFDGRKSTPYTEDDATRPLSAYGASKLAGEQAVRAEGDRWVIARTAWLYGKNGPNFVNRMLKLAREKQELSVVTDQVGSPTWTCDLSHAICALIGSHASGLFHTVNGGCCSRFELVEEIVRSGESGVRLRPVDSSAFPRPARVPSYSPLDTSKLTRETGHLMRPWQEAVTDYIRTL